MEILGYMMYRMHINILWRIVSEILWVTSPRSPIWDLKAVDIGRAKDGEESRKEAQASEASIACQGLFLEIQEQQQREIIMISFTRSSIFFPISYLTRHTVFIFFLYTQLLHPLPQLKLEWYITSVDFLFSYMLLLFSRLWTSQVFIKYEWRVNTPSEIIDKKNNVRLN